MADVELPPAARWPFHEELLVAVIKQEGSDAVLTVEAFPLIGAFHGWIQTGHETTYQISFKTMRREEYKALGEFNGF